MSRKPHSIQMSAGKSKNSEKASQCFQFLDLTSKVYVFWQCPAGPSCHIVPPLSKLALH